MSDSVFLTITQLVDLALCSPEVGNVNFNILHSVLIAIVRKVDLSDSTVEFRGIDGYRIKQLMSIGNLEISDSEKPYKPRKADKELLGSDIVLKPVKGDGESFDRSQKSVKSGKESHVTDVFLKLTKGDKELPDSDLAQTPKEDKQSFDLPQKAVTSDKELADSDPALRPKLDKEPCGSDAIPEATSSDSDPSSLSITVGRSDFYRLVREVQELKKQISSLSGIGSFKDGDNAPSIAELYERLKLSKRIEATDETVTDLAHILDGLLKKQTEIDNRLGEYSPDQLIQSLEQRVKLLEGRLLSEVDESGPSSQKSLMVLSDYLDRFKEMEAKMLQNSQQMGIFQDTFNDLEKEIGEIIEKLNSMGDAPASSVQGNDELFKKMLQMQKEIEKLTKTATDLLADKESRGENMDIVLEQIELLKTVKADREDLEGGLAEKADICEINAKVGYDQFDAAYVDLSENIKDALSKLSQQGLLWQQALDDLQNEIGIKMDKAEFLPLKKFIEDKLKAVQNRVKALSTLQAETEAAGAKSKIISNLNCISCDRKVFMRKEVDSSMRNPTPSFPSNKSIGPYLAYELDHLRREQKCTPNNRNMNHFENALSTKTSDLSHICNRYCGGSHTRTTPQQRVTRLGHFILQWGTLENQKSEGKAPIVVNGNILSERVSHSKELTKQVEISKKNKTDA